MYSLSTTMASLNGCWFGTVFVYKYNSNGNNNIIDDINKVNRLFNVLNDVILMFPRKYGHLDDLCALYHVLIPLSIYISWSNHKLEWYSSFYFLSFLNKVFSFNGFNEDIGPNNVKLSISENIIDLINWNGGRKDELWTKRFLGGEFGLFQPVAKICTDQPISPHNERLRHIYSYNDRSQWFYITPFHIIEYLAASWS